MVVAALLAITLDPALRLLFTRMRAVHASGPRWLRARRERACSSARIHSEETHPISRVLIARLRAGLRAGRCAGRGW